jgi:hypothetical protein
MTDRKQARPLSSAVELIEVAARQFRDTRAGSGEARHDEVEASPPRVEGSQASSRARGP